MSTAAQKPTIVFSHGAWQTAAGYDNFAKKLNGLGFPTEVVPLPSVGGTKSPLPGVPEDVAAVQGALTKHADAGEDIILLCHSYGGMVGSNAVQGLDYASRKAEGKKGGVILTVYLSAFMVPKGKSLLDMLGGQPLPWMSVEGEKCSAVASMMPQVAFNDVSAEVAAFCCAQLTYSSTIVFATPTSYEPWANGVPCAYIFCTEDNALPYPVQQQMAAQLGPEPTTYSLKSGHCPFLSIPDQLVEAIEQASEVGLKKKAA